MLRGRDEREVGNREQGEHRHAGQEHPAAADVVGEQTEGQDHGNVGQAQCRVGVEDRRAVVAQLGRRVGDQPDGADVERGVRGDERPGGQRDLLRVGPQGVEDGHLRGCLRVERLLEDRALGHREPDPEADGDEQCAGQERARAIPRRGTARPTASRTARRRRPFRGRGRPVRRPGARHRRSRAGGAVRVPRPSAPLRPIRHRRRSPGRSAARRAGWAPRCRSRRSRAAGP